MRTTTSRIDEMLNAGHTQIPKFRTENSAKIAALFSDDETYIQTLLDIRQVREMFDSLCEGNPQLTHSISGSRSRLQNLIHALLPASEDIPAMHVYRHQFYNQTGAHPFKDAAGLQISI